MIGLTGEFPHKGVKIMADYLCVHWQSLLQDIGNPEQKYNGQIFNDFLVSKLVLIQHLDACKQCQQLIIELQLPNNDLVPNVSMTDREFSKAIRDLWKLAKQKNRKP